MKFNSASRNPDQPTIAKGDASFMSLKSPTVVVLGRAGPGIQNKSISQTNKQTTSPHYFDSISLGGCFPLCVVLTVKQHSPHGRKDRLLAAKPAYLSSKPKGEALSPESSITPIPKSHSLHSPKSQHQCVKSWGRSDWLCLGQLLHLDQPLGARLAMLFDPAGLSICSSF